MPFEDYTKLETLGKGSYGTVHKVRHRDGTIYAMKECGRPKKLISSIEELVALKELKDHSHIVEYIEHFLNPNQDKLYIVMELCNGGNLEDYVINENPENGVILVLMKHMADAMQYSHKKGIVHRDLKPENVLISIENGKPNAKIADFGIAKIKLSDGDPLPTSGVSYMHTYAGTPFYRAPEVYKCHYKEKADVFSMGLMFCAILERTTAVISGRLRLVIFYDNSHKSLVGEYLFHHPKAVREVSKSVIIQEKVQKLINSMIICEYKARPSAREVYDALNSPMPIIARPEKRNDVQNAETAWFSYCAIL